MQQSKPPLLLRTSVLIHMAAQRASSQSQAMRQELSPPITSLLLRVHRAHIVCLLMLALSIRTEPAPFLEEPVSKRVPGWPGLDRRKTRPPFPYLGFETASNNFQQSPRIVVEAAGCWPVAGVMSMNRRCPTMSVPPELLSQLMVAHSATLELYARQLCDAPEDVVQDAFLKLAAQPELPNRVLPWLFEVTRNRAVSLQRSARRRKRHESQAARPDWFEPNEGLTLDADTATRAIERLSSDEREVLVAHVWGGMTFEEIGRLTRTSSSTAHRRYCDALQQLRVELGVTWLSTTN